jgi:hypothetical protein
MPIAHLPALLAWTLPLLAAGDPPAAPSSAPSAIPTGPLAPVGFSSVDVAMERALELAKLAGDKGRIEHIGTSREGRQITVVTLGNTDPSRKMPAMLVVGGMDAVNFASPEQVLESARAILRDKPNLLDTMRVHLVIVANPDARASAMQSKQPRATNARAVDDDRDGRIDEDGPADFDTDGFVTEMRRVAPPGVTATHMIDPVDPRILRPAKREKGEVATHEILTEGRDNDGDGRIGEDPEGGVDLDRNFPHRWPEAERDAGPYPLSEPESLAIAKFVRAHPEIVTAVVFGRHDTLASFPDTKDKDSTGRTPMVYLTEDHELYHELGKSWIETTKLEKSANADLAGSLVLWLADHRGIAAVAANGWTRPEPPKLAEGTQAPAETGDTEQSAWLANSERAYEAPGFIAWRPIRHPKWGDVEIGGFIPFFRESPTAAQATELAKKCAPFVIDLAARHPVINASEVTITPLSAGLARVALRVTNTGTLASTTEMGRITGVVPPVVVRVGVPPESVLSGRAVEKIERLLPGASVDYEWTIRVPTTGKLDLTISGPTFDTITRTASMAVAQQESSQ